MPRMTSSKRAELEAFWRAHLDGWRRSDLNQREYCEAHGLPLKRFGNWRAKFRDEDPAAPDKLLYRRGGRVRHMSGHMSNKDVRPVSAGYIPSAGSTPPGGRRRFSAADKRRIVEEASSPGGSVSGVARQYGIDTSLLFRWKRELGATKPEATFLPVTVTDAQSQPAEGSATLPGSGPATASAPSIVVERPPGIEVELTGGRRLRFDRDVDPETVRRLVALLEEGLS